MSETKQIGQLLEEQKPQSSGSNASQLTPYQDTNRRLTLERYGDFGSFCKTFDVVEMRRYCTYPARCVNGNAPSLATVKNTYGLPSAKLWLKALVVDYCATVVNRSDRRMTEAQIDDWVDLAITEWGYLTVTEWMLFFHKCKASYFGSLYNDANYNRLSEMVREFVFGEYRKRLKDQFERECKNAMRECEDTERKGKTMTADQFKQTDAYRKLMSEKTPGGAM
jgi:hypothetical protein